MVAWWKEEVFLMEFSVLVIAHQRAGHLQRLLDGVQRNSLLPKEIIVVYMDDPTPEPVSCDVPMKFIHIWSLPGEIGLPLARARNTAAANATTERLVFLDVDCIPSAQAFIRLLRSSEENSALAMAEPRYLREPILSRATPYDLALAELSVPHHARAGLPTNVPCDMHEHFWSLGFSISAGHFDCVGGFSLEYTGYGAEDTDFAFTARHLGIPVVFTRAVVFHQYHGVYKPPLNHFEAILSNASRFYARWGVWPMQGWLRQFAHMGLVRWASDGPTLDVLQCPTPVQVEHARSQDAY